ncbi:MAG: hypothetical protein DRI73_10705 [Bacteroidetes bacterium]|nr:MAG: hypothetical protein DRI73_10705 [Bacteroidota bacterium]
MSSKLTKIISIILWVLLGVSIILVGLFYFGSSVPGTEGTNMYEPKITETLLNWAYIMVIATIVIALGFSIVNLITYPKKLKQAAFMFLGVGVLVVVSYYLASDQALSMPGYDGNENVPKTLKYVGTGLYLTYIIFGIAFLTIVYSEVAKYFK